MNTLLVDIGNSRLKWSLSTDGRRTTIDVFSYREADVSATLERNWGHILPPDQVVIVSVAPCQVNSDITAWIKQQWSITPHSVRSEDPYPGLTCGYDRPEQLGVDRWIAVIAGYHRYKSPVAVVDCGTAVTIDLVDGDGNHHGGWILPGLSMSVGCLRDKTAIPAFDDIQPTTQAGRSTAAAIANGCILTIIGAIEKISNDLAGQPAFAGIRWVITGGDADRLSAVMPVEFERVDELIMDGLQLLADEMVEGK